MRKIFLSLIIMVLGVVPAFAGPVSPGEQAPEFSLESMDGKQVALSDFKGKVIFSGSTERTSFAEKNETKGFLKIGLDPAINNPIEHLDFVPLPSRKMADIQIDSENSTV